MYEEVLLSGNRNWLHYNKSMVSNLNINVAMFKLVSTNTFSLIQTSDFLRNLFCVYIWEHHICRLLSACCDFFKYCVMYGLIDIRDRAVLHSLWNLLFSKLWTNVYNKLFIKERSLIQLWPFEAMVLVS